MDDVRVRGTASSRMGQEEPQPICKEPPKQEMVGLSPWPQAGLPYRTSRSPSSFGPLGPCSPVPLGLPESFCLGHPSSAVQRTLEPGGGAEEPLPPSLALKFLQPFGLPGLFSAPDISHLLVPPWGQHPFSCPNGARGPRLLELPGVLERERGFSLVPPFPEILDGGGGCFRDRSNGANRAQWQGGTAR